MQKSHLNEEVSFQDICGGAYHGMAGLPKIKRCCRQADQDGFECVWIDSCCIDKTSSSELSKAISILYFVGNVEDSFRPLFAFVVEFHCTIVHYHFY
jgi:hypothetical protein